MRGEAERDSWDCTVQADRSRLAAGLMKDQVMKEPSRVPLKPPLVSHAGQKNKAWEVTRDYRAVFVCLRELAAISNPHFRQYVGQCDLKMGSSVGSAPLVCTVM